MQTRAIFLTIAAAAVTAAACGSDSSTQPVSKIVNFSANLNPAGELGVTLNGNPTGSGTFVGSLDTSTHQFTYTLQFSGLSANVNNAHIHGPFILGGASNSAGVILNFNNAAAGLSIVGLGTATTGSSTGTVSLVASNTAIGTATVHGDSIEKLLLAGAAYVNVHTTANAGGEIRGQIARAP